jgi:hypothetical protein
MLLIGLAVAMLVGTVLAVRPQTRQLWSGNWDRRHVRDAILLAVLGIALQVGLRRLGVVLTALDPSHANIDDLLVLASAARPLPWLDLFLDQIRANLLLLPTFAALLYLATRSLGIVRSLVILGATVLLFAAEGAHTPAAFGLQLAMGVARRWRSSSWPISSAIATWPTSWRSSRGVVWASPRLGSNSPRLRSAPPASSSRS